jgi:hypothetical protein
MRRAVLLLSVVGGCVLQEPEPTGIPFVSEQILGHWVGRWMVPLPGQVGDADIVVTRVPGNVVSWAMSLDGGLLSGADDPPLLYDLRGQDDVRSVRLAGDGDKLGHIDLVVDEDGLISGTSDPQSAGPVQIVGLVGEGYIRLDFLVLDILHGKAIVTADGAPIDGLDLDTDDPFADPDPETPVD